MSAKTCVAPFCDRSVRAGDMCDAHRQRLKRHGVYEPNVRRTRYLVEDRFWSQVRMWSLTSPGCLEWMGALSEEGYGKFRRIRSRMEAAHRVAWELANTSSIPDGLIVRHTCDNPRCVNPDHLVVGTHQDNSDDKWRRGRGADTRGEFNGRAKLNAADVVSIRQSSESTRVLADRYSITTTQVRSVKSRKLWKHVG